MDNVIEFPKDKIIRITQDEQFFEDSIESMQQEHINDVMNFIVPMLLRYLSNAGFDLSENSSIKEGAFMVEAIKSSLCHTYDIEHPFQKLAEEVFEIINEDTLKIVTKLDIDLEHADIAEV